MLATSSTFRNNSRTIVGGIGESQNMATIPTRRKILVQEHILANVNRVVVWQSYLVSSIDHSILESQVLVSCNVYHVLKSTNNEFITSMTLVSNLFQHTMTIVA